MIQENLAILVSNAFSLELLRKLLIKKYLFFVFAVAAVAGLFCALLPLTIVVGSMLASIFLLVLYFFPWCGFFIYLIAILLSPDSKLSDIITIVALIVLSARILFLRGNLSLPLHSVRLPYIIFCVVVGFSLALSFFYFKNKIPLIYRDGRIFIYWLFFPVLYSLTLTISDGCRKLTLSLFAFAVFVSIVAIFQALSGIQLVATGRVGALETLGSLNNEITRVQLPGYIFVVFCLAWTIVGLVSRRINLIFAVVAVIIFSYAIYVNFGRALWFWTLFAVILPAIFLPRRNSIILLLLLVLGGASSFGALSLLKPNVVENVAARFQKISEEGKRGTSYGWRKWENEDALHEIIKSPVFGVGVGGEYRRWIPELRTFEDHTRYVHNSYLFFALKLGMPGLLALLWLLGIVWWRTFQQQRFMKSHDVVPFRVAALASVPALLGLGITQPELAQPIGILFFCCLLTVLLAPHLIVNTNPALMKDSD